MEAENWFDAHDAHQGLIRLESVMGLFMDKAWGEEYSAEKEFKKFAGEEGIAVGCDEDSKPKQLWFEPFFVRYTHHVFKDVLSGTMVELGDTGLC